jgi:hypothetical protein
MEKNMKKKKQPKKPSIERLRSMRADEPNTTDPEAINKAILAMVAMTAGGPEGVLGKLIESLRGAEAAAPAAEAAPLALKNVTPRIRSLGNARRGQKAVGAKPAPKALTTAPERSPALPARYNTNMGNLTSTRNDPSARTIMQEYIGSSRKVPAGLTPKSKMITAAAKRRLSLNPRSSKN